MKTNSHILAIDTYLGEMRGMVRALENNPAKEALMNLVQAMTDGFSKPMPTLPR